MGKQGITVDAKIMQTGTALNMQQIALPVATLGCTVGDDAYMPHIFKARLGNQLL